MNKPQNIELRPTDKWFEKRANQLRKEASIRLSNDYKESSVNSVYSHFDAYAEHLPLTSGKKAIFFNELVTDTVMTETVLTEQDPFIVIFLAAKVIEQTYYQIFDHAEPSKPLKNLSVSKHYGVFFTPADVAEFMAKQVRSSEITSVLLDPCAGSGVLLASYLLTDRADQISTIVAIEKDEKLAQWCEKVLKRVAELTEYRGEIKVSCGDGLDYLIAYPGKNARELAIIINPPYGRLRLTNDRASNAETALLQNTSLNLDLLQSSMAENVEALRDIFIGEKGILEYSRLFFRACASLAKNGASAAIISPDAWLSGTDAALLRKILINQNLISKIVLIKEAEVKFATVNQSLAITFIDSQKKQSFQIQRWNENETGHFLNYQNIEEMLRKDLAIPKVSGAGLEVFKRLSSLSKIGEATWIKNARGELDQTANKDLFQKSSSAVPLVRGEHVTQFRFCHSSTDDKPSFINEEGFSAYIMGKPKEADFLRSRIVGRQCSYAQQARRLIFCRVPAKHAIGNSCNYISISLDVEDIKEKELVLVGLLNSAVLDWYFKIENNNNHVANFEIAQFPLPPENRWSGLIAQCVELLEHNNTSSAMIRWLPYLLDAIVSLAYGLDPETELHMMLQEINHSDVRRVVNYARQLKAFKRVPEISKGEFFFNHQDPTLSNLDRLIISHVPEGGNWQNIPDSVPSERLKQIREMAAERGVVRTTYYGRLRRDQPSYTMNTYFNRPGNGTHIHPVLDRTLTSREAARLQSFPDSYVFLGSEGAIRNQIGNAVPPLLAYAIGQKFRSVVNEATCIDMFCGAGGLSLGLERAGWHAVAALDNSKDALNTYCFNRPSLYETKIHHNNLTSVFNRDLQDSHAFEALLLELTAALNGRSLGMLVGGPPCQGFSHAGFRLSDDKRNDLASIYLHFAERLRPKIFILENVEGIATFNQGQVLRDICLTLKELGYFVNDPVWKLSAEQYGVPQMRRRVFIVATLDNKIDLTPPEPPFSKCEGRRSERMDLFESILEKPNSVEFALAGLSMPAIAEASVPNLLCDWLAS